MLVGLLLPFGVYVDIYFEFIGHVFPHSTALLIKVTSTRPPSAVSGDLSFSCSEVENTSFEGYTSLTSFHSYSKSLRTQT